MPAPSIFKKDWERDHVYLVQFPRAGSIPSPSPFALKVETWVRMNDIPYTNISNNFKKMSSKGQIPFIELNGREIADSNIIVRELQKEFKKEEELSNYDQAQVTALHAISEEALRWALFYYRRETSWLTTDEGFGRTDMGGALKKFLFNKIAPKKLGGLITKITHFQGIGRQSPEEVLRFAKTQLDALETFLGSKLYFLGEKASSIDATIFAHLAEFYYGPNRNLELIEHFDKKTPNLVKFMNRMKRLYWPDWEEICSTLQMNTDWKNKQT